MALPFGTTQFSGATETKLSAVMELSAHTPAVSPREQKEPSVAACHRQCVCPRSPTSSTATLCCAGITEGWLVGPAWTPAHVESCCLSLVPGLHSQGSNCAALYWSGSEHCDLTNWPNSWQKSCLLKAVSVCIPDNCNPQHFCKRGWRDMVWITTSAIGYIALGDSADFSKDWEIYGWSAK